MDGSIVLDLLSVQRFADELQKSCKRMTDLHVRADPWPHLFCSDFNTQFMLCKLHDELPPASRFVAIEEGGSILRSSSSVGFYWNLYDACMRHLLFRLMPAFARWMPLKESQLQVLGMTCSRLRPYPSFWGYSNPERGVPPHVDGEAAVLTAVSVMGYANGLPAPVTNFYERQTGTPCGFTPTTDYRPARGSLFVWLNLENTFHGVSEPLKPHRLTHVAAIESIEAT